MHVPHHFSNQNQCPTYVTPFLNANGNIVNPRYFRCVPNHIAINRIDAKRVITRTHLFGWEIVWDNFTVESTTRNQIIGEEVPIGIVCPWVVNPCLKEAGILLRRIEQLHRTVVARLGVNNEQGGNGKRNIYRPGYIQNTVVPIGVFHLNLIDAWTAISMQSTVKIDLHFILKQGFAFTLEAVNGRAIFIPPVEIQPGTIGGRRGLGVGSNKDFIRQSTDVRVRDLSGAIMGCEGGVRRGKPEQNQHRNNEPQCTPLLAQWSADGGIVKRK